MKLTKKLMIIVLAFLMIFSVAGCSGLKVVKEIATVNGNIISKGEFMYYLENVKGQMLQEAGITADSEEAKSFWEGDIDGEKASDVAKNRAMEECIRIEIASILAKEEGLEIPSETKTAIKTALKQGGEQIDQIKDQTGLNDDTLGTLFEKSEYANLYAQSVQEKEAEKLTPADEDVQKKYEEEYVRIKHVLISKTPTEDAQTAEEIEVEPVEEDAEVAEEATEAEEVAEEVAEEATATEDPAAYEEAQKLLAAEVLTKAQSGEDFEGLIAQYGEDPGAESSPDGYTFSNNGQMVKEFEEAAFAMEIGAISDLVETTYGWHILKRYELLTEGEEYTQIIASISNELSQDLYNDYIDALKGNYTIEIRQSTVDGIKVK